MRPVDSEDGEAFTRRVNLTLTRGAMAKKTTIQSMALPNHVLIGALRYTNALDPLDPVSLYFFTFSNHMARNQIESAGILAQRPGRTC